MNDNDPQNRLSGSDNPGSMAGQAKAPINAPDNNLASNSLARPGRLPGIELPVGGGALKSIDESFQINPVNGTHSVAVGLPVSPARSGFAPSLSLNYNTGMGNSEFGLGWSVAVPSIKRSTEKGLPQYLDGEDSDDFLLSGGEVLVPQMEADDDGKWSERTRDTLEYHIRYYRPRTEGSWQRIEQWRHKTSGVVHWRSISGQNVISLFGVDEAARLADPADPKRVFEWRLCRSYDDRGNLTVYGYQKEDWAGVGTSMYDRNRSLATTTNTYLKRVLYGNRVPFHEGDGVPDADGFFFETVFDYGDHDQDLPAPRADAVWDVRTDPFSTYRPGFEVRTYRLCKRVMLFHRFDELPVNPYLIAATELTHQDYPGPTPLNTDVPGVRYLKAVTQRGYLYDEITGTYSSKTMPSVTYHYQGHSWHTEIQQIDEASTYNAPEGIAPPRYQWVDLFGEGVSGIFAEREGDWYYKRNLGNGEFGQTLKVANKPSYAGIDTGAVRLQPLTKSGKPHLVNFSGDHPGFFRLEENDQWSQYTEFTAIPCGRWANDPNARLIDLTGDGQPDILMTEDGFFQWHASLGEVGFSNRQRVAQPLDEEDGPKLVFADQEQVVFLADMSGDGLTDLVRIRNREVCYWANLGYGYFSPKVTMQDAPSFDMPEAFNPAFLRIADIDGSGTADLIYLGRQEVRVWFNLNGNAWTPSPRSISFPAIHRQSNVEVIDLLGKGTACLVWSSPLAEDRHSPLRYIDLMHSKKPHLLANYENGSGRKVSYEYGVSTDFYMADRKAGHPWVSRLPFPVHLVTKTRVHDAIRDTLYTSTYEYHHGYYDMREREFRGFGKVVTRDTENFETFHLNTASNLITKEMHQPPIRTVSWFHTGAPPDVADIEQGYRKEFHDNEQLPEHPLSFTTLVGDFTSREWVQAHRSLKGSLLRKEVYAEDESNLSALPYLVQETAYQLHKIQPAKPHRYGVFMRLRTEALSYAYERTMADPRISHTLELDHDEKGYPLKVASVVYPRRTRPTGLPDNVWQRQGTAQISISETRYVADLDQSDAYRLREPYEQLSFELLNTPLPTSGFLSRDDLNLQLALAGKIDFEQESDGTPQLRHFAHARVYFRDDALASALPLGQRGDLGLVYRAMQMAYTPGLISLRFGSRVTPAMLAAAGYEHSEGDANWWRPSGIALYAVDARDHFYLPSGIRDALGKEAHVVYDSHDLVVLENTNPAGMTITAEVDYRTLKPWRVTDANNNRVAVRVDELGMVVASAVMGKAGAGEGDTLDDPTQRIEYDLFQWRDHQKPNFTHLYARETHSTSTTRWQEQYVYFDASGTGIMAKSQAAPGLAKRWRSDTSSLEEVHSEPRWVGNGRTILNNKGQPIKTYEPYFSTTHEFEDDSALVEIGNPAIRWYDPMGRVVRTDFPNGTNATTQFDSWRLRDFDPNDTILDSDWYAQRGSPDPNTDPEPTDPEARSAWLAAKHADTPLEIHADVLGRPVLSISDYGGGKTTQSRNETDGLGRQDQTFDALGREVSFNARNMMGEVVHTRTAEKGERWLFFDVGDRLHQLWDDQGRSFTLSYDDLHRPVSSFIHEGGDTRAISHLVYGDQLPDAPQRNLVGVAHQVFDQAGVTTVRDVDFKGIPHRVERRLTRDYKTTLDWSALAGLNSVADIQSAAEPLLDAETFVSTGDYDALGRQTQAVLTDGTVMQLAYDEASRIKTLDAQIRGAGDFKRYLEGQNYNARGQRETLRYGNGAICEYSYDSNTFRLNTLITRSSSSALTNQSLQHLAYFYDPVGNVTEYSDAAQQTHFFKNAVVAPKFQYEYDALYHLIRATGREHEGAGWNGQPDHTALPWIQQIPHVNNTNAVRNYTETYTYDDIGNLLRVAHRTSTGQGQWSRHYRYQYQDDLTNTTNRLASTSLPGDAETGPYSATYDHDASGNMTRMPHLDQMTWNFMDQLSSADLGGGGWIFFVYGISGLRRRKVVERDGGTREERIYLGANEIYRERDAGGTVRLERWTLHLGDGAGSIVQIDTKTIDADNADPANPLNANTERYQFGNLMGSATLETDASGSIISYEEYHPFGTSAYRSAKSVTDLSLKRYRFAGKEKDNETGFYYAGARYLSPWLGRWVSSDPAGLVDGFNTFSYARNNPVGRTDSTGTQSTLIQEREVTGEESYQDLRSVPIPAGYEWDPAVTEQNYRSFWDPNARIWGVWREAQPPPPPSPPPEPAEQEPEQTSGTDPPEDPPVNTSNPARTARAIAGVNQPNLSNGQPAPGDLHLYSGTTGNTEAQAAAATGENYYLRDTPHYDRAVNQVNAEQARLGRALDYMSEERPLWDAASRDLAREATLAGRGVESHGLPQYQAETGRPPSGTTQVMEEIPTTIRYGSAMAGLGFLSGGITIYTGSQMDSPVMQGVGYVAGAGEIAGTAQYVRGLYQLHTWTAGSAATMAGGAALARYSGGLGLMVMSGYSGAVHMAEGEYGLLVSDTAGYVGGTAMLAGAGTVAAVAGGVAATNVLGDYVERKVTPEYGRTAGVGAGVAAGAVAGAAIGAAIGVWGFGVAAVPAAAVGAAVGAVAGFIGAYW